MPILNQLQAYRKRGLVGILKDHYWTVHRGMTYLHAWLHRRNRRDTRFIGITGSAGKTTTKELSHLILSSFSESHATPQTENEHLFIARTILETKRHHRYCVTEVAGHQPDYMDLSLRMLKPDIGVLTIIGNDHFRAFKGAGIDGIAREKSKLIDSLSPDGVAVLNIDDPRVRAIGERCRARIIWVGKAEGATLRLLSATSRWPEPLKLTIEYQNQVHEVVTQLHGTQLSLSVLAALGVALAAGIPLKQAIPVLRQATPTEGRMQIVSDNKGVTFIRDDLKAPAWSLQAVLDFLNDAKAIRKVAVMGSISDFSGDDSKRYKQFARQIRQYADLVVFVGPNAHRALRARKDEHDLALQGFLTLKEASDYLQTVLSPGDLVLLKGSNTADHLSRLVLDRSQPIKCWRHRCGLNMFCSCCSYLYRQNSEDDQEYSSKLALTKNKTTKPSTSASLTLATPITLITGLGNPSKEFEATPHNAGYQVLDQIAKRFDGQWQSTEAGLVSLVNIDGNPVQLFKPAANMNVIGPVLRQFLAKNGCAAEHCIIIHDDMDLELGKIRLKHEGGDAGHRGVRSVIMALGTDAIRRVRVGVRQPGDQRKAKDIVLTRFTSEEIANLDQAIEQSMALIAQHIQASKS